MIKQSILVGAIALAAVGAASADGFYVGGQLGGISLNDKVTNTNTFSGTLNSGVTAASETNTHNLGAMGVNGGLLAGYGWTFPNQFYLGTEVFGDVTSAKISHTVSGSITQDGVSSSGSTSSNLKLRYNYGVRALPGFAVTPDTTVYGIVGYVRGNFKLSDSYGSATYNANGYQLGLGAKTNVAKNVAIRGDFIYSGYASKTYSFTGTGAYNGDLGTGTGTVTSSHKLQPKTMEANVAVVYSFG